MVLILKRHGSLYLKSSFVFLPLNPQGGSIDYLCLKNPPLGVGEWMLILRQLLDNQTCFSSKYFEDRKKDCFFASAFLKFFKRSIRLVVRTSGFHPGNRGSIPLWTTKIDLILFLTA